MLMQMELTHQEVLNNIGMGNDLSTGDEHSALAPAGRDMVDRELKEKQQRKRRGLSM